MVNIHLPVLLGLGFALRTQALVNLVGTGFNGTISAEQPVVGGFLESVPRVVDDAYLDALYPIPGEQPSETESIHMLHSDEVEGLLETPLVGNDDPGLPRSADSEEQAEPTDQEPAGDSNDAEPQGSDDVEHEQRDNATSSAILEGLDQDSDPPSEPWDVFEAVVNEKDEDDSRDWLYEIPEHHRIDEDAGQPCFDQKTWAESIGDNRRAFLLLGAGLTAACQKKKRKRSPTRGPDKPARRSKPRFPSMPSDDILKEPETRPISQEQLVAEVRGIYAGLIKVENRCLEVDGAKNGSAQNMSDKQWQALIDSHRKLLREHHDFLLASQHPLASPALRRLEAMYAVPSKLWPRGIQSSMKLLRHKFPESRDHTVALEQLAYSIMSRLKTSAPASGDSLADCLGDLDRYGMGIEDDDIRDREIWTEAARQWDLTVSDSPLEENANRALPEDFAMQGLSWTGQEIPEDWFDGSNIDEDEKYFDNAMMSDEGRIRWSASPLPQSGSSIVYDTEAHAFHVRSQAEAANDFELPGDPTYQSYGELEPEDMAAWLSSVPDTAMFDYDWDNGITGSLSSIDSELESHIESDGTSSTAHTTPPFLSEEAESSPDDMTFPFPSHHVRPVTSATDECAYPCPHCSQIFSRRCDLSKHLPYHDKPIPCPVSDCTERFATKRDLERHKHGPHKDIFGEKRFGCHRCDKAFGRKDHLTRHMKTSHMDE